MTSEPKTKEDEVKLLKQEIDRLTKQRDYFKNGYLDQMELHYRRGYAEGAALSPLQKHQFMKQLESEEE